MKKILTVTLIILCISNIVHANEITNVDINCVLPVCVGDVLTGTYESSAESVLNYSWHISDTIDFSTSSVILGAKGLTYQPTEADIGKYIKFAVDAIESPAYGPILGAGEVSHNLAENKTVTGHAYKHDGSNANATATPAKNAVDGNEASKWESQSTTSGVVTGDLVIDLGKVHQFNKFVVTQGTKRYLTYDIDYSNDGVEWKTLVSQAKITSAITTQPHLSQTAQGRYVRLNITSSSSGGGYYLFSICEFEIYYDDFIGAVARACEAIELEDGATITSNLNLPAEGLYGTSISWKSSNEEFIDNNGKITRPTWDSEDAEVTLTATVTKEDTEGRIETQTKIYNLKVAKSSIAYLKGINCSSFLSGSPVSNILDGDISTAWKPENNNEDEWIIIDFGKIVPFDGLMINELSNSISGFSVQISDNSTKWTNIYTGETIGRQKEILISAQQARYIKININSANNIAISEIEAYVTDETMVMFVLNNLDLGVDTLNAITEDLILRTKGDGGTTISWISSSPAVVTAFGTVKRQTTDTVVTLTANVEKKDMSLTKDFKITVLKKPSTGGGGGGGGGSGGGTVITLNTPVVTPIPKPKSVNFSDIKNVEWAANYIIELAQNDIIDNTSDKYRPTESITREDFVMMIVSAFKLMDDTTEIDFNDLDNNSKYYKYISSAVKAKVINGIGDNAFGMGKNITRQDMATIAYRAINIAGGVLSNEIENTTFEDDSQISDYAKEAVYSMQKSGIINGFGNNYYIPNAFTTRAEAAKVIYLLWKKL